MAFIDHAIIFISPKNKTLDDKWTDQLIDCSKTLTGKYFNIFISSRNENKVFKNTIHNWFRTKRNGTKISDYHLLTFLSTGIAGQLSVEARELSLNTDQVLEAQESEMLSIWWGIRYKWIINQWSEQECNAVLEKWALALQTANFIVSVYSSTLPEKPLCDVTFTAEQTKLKSIYCLWHLKNKIFEYCGVFIYFH